MENQRKTANISQAGTNKKNKGAQIWFDLTAKAGESLPLNFPHGHKVFHARQGAPYLPYFTSSKD